MKDWHTVCHTPRHCIASLLGDNAFKPDAHLTDEGGSPASRSLGVVHRLTTPKSHVQDQNPELYRGSCVLETVDRAF